MSNFPLNAGEFIEKRGEKYVKAAPDEIVNDSYYFHYNCKMDSDVISKFVGYSLNLRSVILLEDMHGIQIYRKCLNQPKNPVGIPPYPYGW